MPIHKTVSFKVGSVTLSLTAMTHLMKRIAVCCHMFIFSVLPKPIVCVMLATCPLGFLCDSDEHCIAEHHRCDNETDCKNGEDEQNCSKLKQ